eukprot:scaffold2730_cov247-Pinguiococcus_pyrenoidosus.AAC.8
MRAVSRHPSIEEHQNLDKQTLSLTKCLEVFSEEEKIPDGFCSKCRVFRNTTLKSELWRLPPVLVIHLKRFQFTSYSRRKLNNLVQFPVEGLDLQQFVADPNGVTKGGEASGGDKAARDEAGAEEEEEERSLDGGASLEMVAEPPNRSCLFDLFAVVHHVGVLGAGHYVATLLGEDGKWYCFNDGQVHETGQKDIVSPSAYVLFYRRRDLQNVPLSEFFPASATTAAISAEELNALVQRRDLQNRCAHLTLPDHSSSSSDQLKTVQRLDLREHLELDVPTSMSRARRPELDVLTDADVGGRAGLPSSSRRGPSTTAASPTLAAREAGPAPDPRTAATGRPWHGTRRRGRCSTDTP